MVSKNSCYWYHLPVYNKNSGKKIQYEVKEVVPAGYVQSDFSVSNAKNYGTYGSSTVGASSMEYKFAMTNQTVLNKITVKKIWEDNADAAGIRPETITMRLLQEGKVIDTVQLSEENNWTHSWEKLEIGLGKLKEIYSVKEAEVPDGYQTEVITREDGTVEIVNTCKKQDYQVTVLWQDEENEDGLRPESLQLQLYRNGEVYGEAVSVTAEDNWTYSWKDMAVYQNNQETEYTVKQVSVPSGYKESKKENDGIATEFTNTHIVGTTLTVQKIWEDNNDADGIRPESIQVQLYANGGVKGQPVTLSESNNWQYVWDELPAAGNNKSIVYSIKELNIPEGYSSTQKEVENGNIQLVNTHAVEETHKITITWEDQTTTKNLSCYMPDELKVYLYDAEGNKLSESTVTGANNVLLWEGEYSAVNAAKASLQESALYDALNVRESNACYTVETEVLENGVVSIKIALISDDSDTDGKMDINAYLRDATWATRAELYANEKLIGEKNVSKGYTVNWPNMPIFDENSDAPIDYYVIFYGNDGKKVSTTDKSITKSIPYTGANMYWSLTLNAYDNVSDVKQINRTFDITWSLYRNIEDILPLNFTVYGDGQKVGSIEIDRDEEGIWQILYTNEDGTSYYPEKIYDGNGTIRRLYFPAMDSSGKTITYHMEIEDFPGKENMECIISGFYAAIYEKIDKVADGKIPLYISKSWEDIYTIPPIRPETVIYHIYANGELYETVELKSSDLTSYSSYWYKYIYLPNKGENGNEIEYTIEEEEIDGYYLKRIDSEMYRSVNSRDIRLY